MKLYLFSHVDDFDVQFIVMAESKRCAITKMLKRNNSFENYIEEAWTPEGLKVSYDVVEFNNDIVEYDSELSFGDSIFRDARYGKYGRESN